MSKSELEPKLAQVMSDISETEGIVALDPAGKLISGQTIEDMNKNTIAETVSQLIQCVNKLGGIINKGKVTEVTLGLEKGFVTVEVGSKYSIAAFVDNDGKSQLALLSRTIKNLL